MRCVEVTKPWCSEAEMLIRVTRLTCTPCKPKLGECRKLVFGWNVTSSGLKCYKSRFRHKMMASLGLPALFSLFSPRGRQKVGCDQIWFIVFTLSSPGQSSHEFQWHDMMFWETRSTVQQEKSVHGEMSNTLVHFGRLWNVWPTLIFPTLKDSNDSNRQLSLSWVRYGPCTPISVTHPD